MLDAHVRSMVLLGTPFNASTPQPFTFGPKSKWAEITAEIRAQIPVMLQHRLTPPPRETYSLNRYVCVGLVFEAFGLIAGQKTEWGVLAGVASERVGGLQDAVDEGCRRLQVWLSPRILVE